MKNMWSSTVFLLLSLTLPAHAADNMKRFPQRIRAWFDMSWPTSDHKMRIRFQSRADRRKDSQVDEKNKYFFGGTIEEKPIKGVGIPQRYICQPSLGRWQARSWQSIQTRRKWPALSRLAAIPI